MKKYFTHLFIVFFLFSCNGQKNETIKIDASKVKEITIINKLDCSYRNYKKDTVIIKEKEKIQKIINAFSYLQPISDRGSINLKEGNGFFDLIFKEGETEHYYTIFYTVYDGVIIWSNDGGKLFKNDRLEMTVTNYL
jgi:hypothetical protein